MSDSSYSAGQSNPPAGRLGGLLSGGTDLFRRAVNAAAREQMNQVREETVERLAPVARSTGMMVGGGLLAAYGGVYVVHGIMYALATRMPRWLASVLTGTVIALGGAALVVVGRRQVKGPDEPDQADIRQSYPQAQQP